MKKNIFIPFLVFHFSAFAQQNIMDSLQTALKMAKEDTVKIETLIAISQELTNSEPTKSIEYAKQALFISEKIKKENFMARSYHQIAWASMAHSNYEDGLEFNHKALEIFVRLGNKKALANTLTNIGNSHFFLGDYANALQFYLKVLNVREEMAAEKPEDIPNKRGMAIIYNNMGGIQFKKGEYDKAMEYYLSASKIREEIGDKAGLSGSYNNIAGIHHFKHEYDKALEYHFKSLKIREESRDKRTMATSYGNIGLVYSEKGDYGKALEYFLKDLKICEETDYQHGVAGAYFNIGKLLLQQKKTAEARNYLLKGLKIVKKVGSKDDIKEAFLSLSECDSSMESFQSAYESYKFYSQYKDSIFNEESSKQVAEMQTKYETEKKQKQIEIQQLEISKKEAEVKKQQTFFWATAGGLALVAVFAFFIYTRLRIIGKQKGIIEKQKSLVDEKNKFLEDAKSLIEEKNKNITDSIQYAQRIQRAFLTSEKYLNKFLPEYFILFKPKDIVSGDFYWALNKNGKSLIATADCTGHGVPGAFMSMIGISFLNEIALEKNILQPDLILNELRENIIKSLNPDDENKMGYSSSKMEIKDGMDVALCSFDFEKMELLIAAANNPVWLIRNNTFTQVNPDKMPVGKYPGEIKPFALQQLPLQKGDCIYSFSDGFADQFGGPKGKKFKYSQFEKLLVSIQDKTMKEQKEILNNTIDEWRGNLDQIDDICVIGVKI